MFIELEGVFAREGERKDIDSTFPIDDIGFASPVRVTGEVANRTGIVYLDARAEFDYSTFCARCGKPLLRHARVPIRHILVSHLDSENDDDDYIIVDNMRFDPDGLATEDIYLALPPRFLCKEDCRGLCPVCGSDLNCGVCGCKKPTDARWDALKDLLN